MSGFSRKAVPDSTFLRMGFGIEKDIFIIPMKHQYKTWLVKS